MHLKPKDIRLRAGRSRAWVAVHAGVSEPTTKLFELDPDAVRDAKKRQQLARVYEGLESETLAATA